MRKNSTTRLVARRSLDEGKGVAGPGLDQFDAPTDVAIAPNGDIFVGDGHNGGGTATGNARIMKFDKHGKFIKTWGKKGMGPGEFDVIHTLAFDSQGRLFVGDRQNNRIQTFDQDGKTPYQSTAPVNSQARGNFLYKCAAVGGILST